MSGRTGGPAEQPSRPEVPTRDDDPTAARAERGRRVWSTLVRLRAGVVRSSPAGRRWAMAVALVVFVGAAVVAFRNLPSTDEPVRWSLVFVATVVGAPAAVLLNTLEYQATARSVGHTIGLRPALRVTVLGSAANLLPLPGSTLVRMHDMTVLGSTARSAGAASVMTGLVWVGVTVALAGAAHALTGGLGLGVVVAVAGVAVTVAGLAVLWRRGAPLFWLVAPRLLGIEVLFVLVAAARLYLILLGMGIDVGMSDAVGLTVAAAVATAAGVLPAGLGLREVLTGLISPLVGIPAAAGVMAAVIDRIARMVMLAVLAGVFVVVGRRSTAGDGGAAAGSGATEAR